MILSVCMYNKSQHCYIYVCVLLLIQWKVNNVFVFHSTDPSEYCIYFRLSDYIINTVRIFPCGVLAGAFSATSPAGSSMLVVFSPHHQAGWMGRIYWGSISRYSHSYIKKTICNPSITKHFPVFYKLKRTKSYGPKGLSSDINIKLMVKVKVR